MTSSPNKTSKKPLSKKQLQEFVKRRDELMAHIGEDSIAIVPSASEVIRNRDVEFPFRQDSDFYYLTGFDEPDAVVVLIPGREHGEYILFCRDRNREMEIWNGYRAGPEGACKDYGADDAFPIDDIDDILPGLLEGCNRIHYAMGKHKAFDTQVMNWINSLRSKVRAGAHAPSEFIDLDHVLHEQRLIKSAHEIKLMRKASDITARAHCRAMQQCEPGMMEYQLEAEIRHEFAMAGARLPAYNSIVGSGDNACILHYVENSKRMNKGELVLIDAGCEYDYYASDITRTFPVSGKFSRAQKALYNVVLKAQLAAIEAVKPGNPWDLPHQETVRVITQGLIDLGLLKGSLKKNIEKATYREFYMHRAGHWLGMDVHDVGEYKLDGEWRDFEEGMVLTIEPGIYVSPDNKKVDAKWRGIGIRIEDDVVVTKNGCEVLTSAVPKTIAEIEALMAA